MNNSNLGNNAKDNAIKSVFTNNNSSYQANDAQSGDDKKERIEYQPSQMTEAEEFFGPQKQKARPDSLEKPNPTIKSFSDETLQSQAQGAVVGDTKPTSDPDSGIDVQHYDVATSGHDVATSEDGTNSSASGLDEPIIKQVHNYADADEQSQPNTQQNPPFKPIKIHDDNHAVGIATTIAIIVLSLGFGGGYFGYNLSSGFLKNQMVSADEETSTPTPTMSISPEASPSASPSPSTSVSANPSDEWSIYKNTKYNFSVKYPDTWFGQGTNNEQSASVQLTSFKPSTTGSEIQNGYKVEVMFQDAKGKLLKDWIEANSAVTGSTSKLAELKIDGKDAYQQVIDSVGKSVNTYVFQADKIMVISYYAGATDFEKGKTIYQNIIESINLL